MFLKSRGPGLSFGGVFKLFTTDFIGQIDPLIKNERKIFNNSRSIKSQIYKSLHQNLISKTSSEQLKNTAKRKLSTSTFQKYILLLCENFCEQRYDLSKMITK